MCCLQGLGPSGLCPCLRWAGEQASLCFYKGLAVHSDAVFDLVQEPGTITAVVFSLLDKHRIALRWQQDCI